jgi:hypothetical protein
MMEDNISSQLLMGVARPWHMSKNTNQKSKKREKESKLEIKFGFDTILNYHLSQNIKLIGRSKFN